MQAIVIVNELSGCSNFIFRIVAMNNVNSAPGGFFVWMIAGIVYRHFMSFFYKTFSKMLGKLLKSSISIGNTTGSKNANFHEVFILFYKLKFAICQHLQKKRTY